MIPNQTRTSEKRKKTITLTNSGREQIQAFADTNHMTFSAAIETLALISMEADLTVLLVPLLQETVAKALQRNFNRFAKLTLLAAAEASMTHNLSRMLLLQMVRQEAVHYPEDFETRLGVSYDPADQPDARIRELYNHLQQLARKQQQQALKRPLAQLVKELSTVDALPNETDTSEGGNDD